MSDPLENWHRGQEAANKHYHQVPYPAVFRKLLDMGLDPKYLSEQLV